MGYVVIVQDSTGYVLKSFLGFIYARFSLSIVEAFAIREALSWLKSLTFDNIIVESDCLLVISALSRPSYDFSKSSVLLYGCLPMKPVLMSDSSVCQQGNSFISSSYFVTCKPHGMGWLSRHFF
ncbi:hypothetical protein Godav_028610 [Gossypium davidsonii]|uniref:RNase H type-1 domain-containing protein n=1 Tax=Gossypium davidsonii TaxID=34287 RepID=A0A7J8S1I9_GOSDV|nr:hypothetical protein [Gossypium davidsonii]